MSLVITDNVSRRRVVEIFMTPKQFADLITGRNLEEIDADWYDTEHIGWKVTNETLPVKVPPNTDYKDHAAALAAVDAKVKELEEANPGCVISARENDAWNMHRLTDKDGDMDVFSVVFWTLHPPEPDDDGA